jgi:hypothetical protein
MFVPYMSVLSFAFFHMPGWISRPLADVDFPHAGWMPVFPWRIALPQDIVPAVDWMPWNLPDRLSALRES